MKWIMAGDVVLHNYAKWWPPSQLLCQMRYFAGKDNGAHGTGCVSTDLVNALF